MQCTQRFATFDAGLNSRTFGAVRLEDNLTDETPDLVLSQDAPDGSRHDEDEVQLDPFQLVALYDYLTPKIDRLRTLAQDVEAVEGGIYRGKYSEELHEVVAIFPRNGEEYVTYTTSPGDGFLTIRRDVFEDGRFHRVCGSAEYEKG